jgi:WD40 repeat protein
MDVHHDRVVTTGTDGIVRVWKTTDLSKVAEWKAHERRIRDVLVLPDGDRVATASLDGEIRIWTLDGNLQNRLIVHRLRSMLVAGDRQQILLPGRRKSCLKPIRHPVRWLTTTLRFTRRQQPRGNCKASLG